MIFNKKKPAEILFWPQKQKNPRAPAPLPSPQIKIAPPAEIFTLVQRPVTFITAQEERKLIYQYQAQAPDSIAAKEALDRLVQAHLLFIRKEAYRYYQATIGAMEFKDLIQSGVAGFIKGLRKFRLERKCRLLTYVGWWISREINEDLLVGGFLVRTIVKSRQGTTNLRQAAQTSRAIISLDQSPLADERYTLHEILPHRNDDQKFVKDIVFFRQIMRLIIEQCSLTRREWFILEHRLLAQQPLTLNQCGDILLISREMVRQHQKNLLKKLRLAALRLGIRQCPA